MSPSTTATDSDFGQGRTLTRTLIQAWNDETYGVQNESTYYPDIWGLSEVQACSGNDWFVPSKSEWAAFGYNLKLGSDGAGAENLSEYYWSSSICNEDDAYRWERCGLVRGCTMTHNSNTIGASRVRLSATF